MVSTLLRGIASITSKTSRSSVLLAAALAFLAPPVSAQPAGAPPIPSPSLAALSQEFRDLRARGQIREAIALGEAEISEMERQMDPDDGRLYGPTSELLDLYARAPNPQRSRPHLERLLRITDRRQEGMPPLAGPYLQLQGVAVAVRDFEFADRVLKRLQSGPAAEAKPGLIALLRARALALQGRNEEAARQYEDVPGSELDAALLMEDYDRAERLLSEAIAALEARKAEPGDLALLSALVDLIGIQQKQGDHDQAWRTFRRAAEEQRALADRMLLDVGLGEAPNILAHAFFRWQVDAALSLHFQSTNKTQSVRIAFESVLRWKGADLDAALRTRRAIRRAKDPKVRTIADRYAAMRSSLVTQTLEAGRAGEAEWARLEELGQQVSRIGSQLLGAVELSEGTASKDPQLAAVGRKVPRDAALLEFVVYDRLDRIEWNTRGAARYAVFVLREDRDPIAIDLGTAETIDRTAEQLRAELERGYGQGHRVPATDLFNLVIAPTLPHLGGARHLLLSPDGHLRVTPFAALLDDHGQPLIEHFILTQLDSSRDLLANRVAEPREPPVVIANPRFGDRGETDSDRRGPVDLNEMSFVALLGAAEEGDLVASLLPTAALVTGDRATETRLRQLHGPLVLHLATHGFFLPDKGVRPSAGAASRGMLASGLALAGFNRHGSGNDDGFLSGFDAAALDLVGTKLVVLSACETGLGELQNLDGVYGIRRGFQLAGAESLLVTLWTIGDTATRDLMAGYYRHLLAGVPRAAALREIQRSFIADPDWSHPFHWAAFVHIGRWEPMSFDIPGASTKRDPDELPLPALATASPQPSPTPPKRSAKPAQPTAPARATRNIRLKPVRVGAVWHLQVIDIAPDSPFIHVGLRAGDTITSFDGHPLYQVTDIPGFFAALERGTTLTVVNPEGEERRVTTEGVIRPD